MTAMNKDEIIEQGPCNPEVNKPIILGFLFGLKLKFNLLRLRFLNIIIKDYTNKSIAKRLGSCNPKMCNALCCQPCEYLDNKLRCKIYDKRYLNKNCRPEIPVDKFELKFFKMDKNKCGYYWK